MKYFALAAAILYLSSCPSAYGLKCYEGFNMSLKGIPLSYWNERECKGNSKCIEQEVSLETDISGNALTSIFRYGACMNSVYANYLDCETLFGKESTFDPSNLLDIIPGIEVSLDKGVEEFLTNSLASLKDLLSDGRGMKAFVDGIYTFYENLGFNLTKAIPLKPFIVKILVSTFTTPQYGQQSALNMAYVDFFNALAQLDTANSQFSTAIRTILTNVGVDRRNFENADIKALTDRGPGLLRSMLPAAWKMELWYDVAFKLAGNINPRNWTESSKAIVSAIKSSYRIPWYAAVFVYPILDAIPDLATGSQMNPVYVGQWSLDLLTKFSTFDSASNAFSSSLVLMLSNLFRIDLQKEFESTIYWLPGLFYKMFPGDKIVIEEVYRKMGKGLMSFNALNISSTAPDTKLSNMIKNMIFTLCGQANFQSQPLYNAFVVNFAKMFYDLMNVTSTDYTGYIDDFATVIDDEFKMWPSINVGKLIGNLIVKMGGKIPLELKPLLDNIQPTISAAMQQTTNDSKLLSALYEVTASYQASYPNSEFPELVKRFITITYQFLTADPHSGLYGFSVLGFVLEIQFWNIDLQFAIVKAYNFDADKLYRMMVKAWPQYDLYIWILTAVDPEDVKQLMKEIIISLAIYPTRTTKSFVAATKPTLRRLSNSIKALLGDIRQSFAPNSCRFASCSTDLCNMEHFTKELRGIELPKQIGSTASSSHEREATTEPLDILDILNWNVVTAEPNAPINWIFGPSINWFGFTDDVKLDETTTSKTTDAMEVTAEDNEIMEAGETASSVFKMETTFTTAAYASESTTIIDQEETTYFEQLYDTTVAIDVATHDEHVPESTAIVYRGRTTVTEPKPETTVTTTRTWPTHDTTDDRHRMKTEANHRGIISLVDTTAYGMEPDSRPIGLETIIAGDTQTHIATVQPLSSARNTPKPTRETTVAAPYRETTYFEQLYDTTISIDVATFEEHVPESTTIINQEETTYFEQLYDSTVSIDVATHDEHVPESTAVIYRERTTVTETKPETTGTTTTTWPIHETTDDRHRMKTEANHRGLISLVDATAYGMEPDSGPIGLETIIAGDTQTHIATAQPLSSTRNTPKPTRETTVAASYRETTYFEQLYDTTVSIDVAAFEEHVPESTAIINQEETTYFEQLYDSTVSIDVATFEEHVPESTAIINQEETTYFEQLYDSTVSIDVDTHDEHVPESTAVIYRERTTATEPKPETTVTTTTTWPIHETTDDRHRMKTEANHRGLISLVDTTAYGMEPDSGHIGLETIIAGDTQTHIATAQPLSSTRNTPKPTRETTVAASYRETTYFEQLYDTTISIDVATFEEHVPESTAIINQEETTYFERLYDSTVSNDVATHDEHVPKSAAVIYRERTTVTETKPETTVTTTTTWPIHETTDDRHRMKTEANHRGIIRLVDTTAYGMEPDSGPIGLETIIAGDTQTHIATAQPLSSTRNTPKPTLETKVAAPYRETTYFEQLYDSTVSIDVAAFEEHVPESTAIINQEGTTYFERLYDSTVSIDVATFEEHVPESTAINNQEETTYFERLYDSTVSIDVATHDEYVPKSAAVIYRERTTVTEPKPETTVTTTTTWPIHETTDDRHRMKTEANHRGIIRLVDTTAYGMEPDSGPIGLETIIAGDTQTHIATAQPLSSTRNTPKPTLETKVATSAHEETPNAFAVPSSNNGNETNESSLSTSTISINMNASISSLYLESKTESATSLTATGLEGSVQNATARGSLGGPLNTTSTGQRFSHYSLLNTFALCLAVQLLYR